MSTSLAISIAVTAALVLVAWIFIYLTGLVLNVIDECNKSESVAFDNSTDLVEEINKGVAMANAHFKNTGVKTKAYDVHSVVVEKVKGE